jgi:ABC-type antimicrobial peptide transport system permease subunit
MLALRNLLRQKTRSLLTLFGVIIGIASVVSLTAIANGMAEGYTTMVSGGKADLVVMQEGSYDLMMSIVDEEIGPQLAAMPEVRSVSRLVYTWVQAGEAQYVSLFGYDPQEEAIERFRVVEGKGLSNRGHEVLLGRLTARNIKKGVGDTVNILNGAYKVVGIYETGDALSDGGILTTVESAQTMLGRPRKVASFQLRLRSPQDEEAARQRIGRRFARLSVSRTSEFGDSTLMASSLQGLGWGIALLAVIIGGITMTNTLVMSVFERTREIGVLRAVGWSKRRVLGMFLSESLILAIVGGALGAGLGVLIVGAAAQSPQFGGILGGRITPAVILQGFGVAVVMGLIGGLAPAWRAAQLAPLEALRYEGGGGRELKQSGVLRRLGPTLRGLLRRRSRTFLTIMGTTVGVAAIVSLQALIDGALADFNKLFSGFELVAAQANVADQSFSNLDEAIGRRIAAEPGVQYVEGTIFNATAIPRQGFLMMEGLHPSSVAIRRFKIVDGQPLAGDREMILGFRAADNLDKSVGETLRIMGSTFRIVGLYETGMSWEDGGAVITLRSAQRLFGQPQKVTWFSIKVDDPEQAEAVRSRLEVAYPKLNVALSSSYISNSDDMQSMYALMGMIWFLAIVVGGLGMMNTMVMSVLERTREIGLLRAVGWRRRRVLWLILQESLALGVLGGLAGLAVGVGLAWGLGLSPIMAAFVKPLFTAKLAGIALAIAVGLGVLGGLYPAWRATQMSPIEALRYE